MLQPSSSGRIPLSRPTIEGVDRDSVLQVLEGTTLALGPKTRELEERFESRFGMPAALVSSGTAALYLSLRALGVEGGEVITPSYGFVATAHAIALAGATPRFADVHPKTGCLTLDSVIRAFHPAVRAIVPVHIFGTPAPVDEIVAWASERQIPVIEDACEALGSERCGRSVGTIGSAGTFAFYPNKQMTLGEGGLVVSPHGEVIEAVRRMRNQGRTSTGLEFAGEGFNFRITELQAALGLAQIERVDRWIERRDHLAARYIADFSAHPGIETLPPVPAGDRRSWFAFPIFLENRSTRDRVAASLDGRGIDSAPYFPGIDRFPPYDSASRVPSDLPATRGLSDRGLAIPFFPGLAEPDRRFVASVILGAVGSVEPRMRPVAPPSAPSEPSSR